VQLECYNVTVDVLYLGTYMYYSFLMVVTETIKKGSRTMKQGQGPTKLDGTPDQRFKGNEQEGTPAYDSRHRNPHQGQPPPERQRSDRPVGGEGDITNADGTLDMRFLENRIKAGLVADPTQERKWAEEDEPNVAVHQRKGRSKR
jgi:hypothetical protein